MPRYALLILARDQLPPCAAVTIGALDFRRYTTVRGSSPDLPDQTHLGAVAEHSLEQIAEFREKVKHFVVRWHWGEKKGVRYLRAAQVIDTRIRERGAYQKSAEDEPLERYLQVQELPIGELALIGAGNLPPEHVETAVQAKLGETIARQDPADARTRAQHGRAKARGESVSGDSIS